MRPFLRTATVGAVLLAMVQATPAHAAPADPPATSERQWVPNLALEVGSFDERLRLNIDGTTSDSYRTQLRTLLLLGLSHPVLRFSDPRLWLDGNVSAGFGLVLDSGDWQVPIREDVTLAWAATRWATLRVGLGLGLALDATSTPRSSLELALPIGVTFFRRVELVYRPLLSIPLGSESSAVFGGERQLSTRFAIQPLQLLLRMRVDAFGW